MDLNSFLKLLDKATESGQGYRARCPSHFDKNPSLSVRDGVDRILLKCHSGCSAESVTEALGLRISDLFYEGKPRAHQKRRIEKTYPYSDEQGELLFETVRYEPKDFRQRRPDGKGGYIWNLKGTRLVPYNLPEVITSDRVYICEGEKDAESLIALGLVATCSPMGAGKWRKEFNEFFKDKKVIILPDNDEAGKQHAQDIAQNLHGLAKEIKVVELPDLPHKGDVSDFLSREGSEAKLDQIVAATAAWPPPDKLSEGPVKGFSFTTVNQLISEPEEECSFIWENILPTGGFSVCSAKPKVGKSTFVRNLAVSISNGESFLGRATEAGKIIYLCLEEKRAEVARHFRQMGSENDRILLHTGPAPTDALRRLEEVIETAGASLAIIDPLSRMLEADDFNSYGEMARGTAPYVDLARRTNCHILAVHHDGKENRYGGDALLGSTALFGSLDTHIQIKKQQDYRTVSTTQRYGLDLPETVIRLDSTSGRLLDSETVSDLVGKEDEDLVLEFVKARGSVEPSAIKAGISAINNGRVQSALSRLVTDGHLKKIGRGVKGDPCFYSLKGNCG